MKSFPTTTITTLFDIALSLLLEFGGTYYTVWEQTSEEPIKTTTIDKVQLKCDCVDMDQMFEVLEKFILKFMWLKHPALKV